MGFIPHRNWPRYEAILDGFETGSHELRPEHRSGIDNEIMPILRACRVGVILVGGASPIWLSDPKNAPLRNVALSRRRLQSVELHIRGRGGLAGLVINSQDRIAMGSQAHLGPGDNNPADRAVAIRIEPLPVQEAFTNARERIRQGFQRVIPTLPPRSPSDSSEDRAWEFESFRARMQGYGFVMKSYLCDGITVAPFLNKITLEPKEVHFTRGEGRGESGAWRTGEREAHNVWSQLRPTDRWNVRSDGPHPTAAMDILRQMCQEFKRIWQRFAIRGASWPPGECEFYDANDESRQPL